MLRKKAHRVFSRVGVSGGMARRRPWLSIYAPGLLPVVVWGTKHHTPVGPRDGWTQSAGSVSTVSPIITVLSSPSYSRRATVVSTQSSTPQQAWLPRPFQPANQAKSAPKCSVRPIWHHRISSTVPTPRAARPAAGRMPSLLVSCSSSLVLRRPCGLAVVPPRYQREGFSLPVAFHPSWQRHKVSGSASREHVGGGFRGATRDLVGS